MSKGSNITRKPGVASLERGLSILTAFECSKDTLTLTELFEITGLNKSTILRLCVSLENLGFLKRRQDGLFQLGMSIFVLGQFHQRLFGIADLAGPVLDRLVKAFDESVMLMVPDNNHVVCVHKIESSQAIRDAGIKIGDRYKIDRCAASGIFRSFSGEAGDVFDQIRAAMIVESRGVLFADAAALGCPVFDFDNNLFGAILISGPRNRFTAKIIEEIKGGLIETAAELTRELGGDPIIYSNARYQGVTPALKPL
ncbi:MAG: IclR family transcriptional regulator [Rhodospirillales bacterium]|nr:IclR family transcriptional regulator [Rhodospirillales bacterium]MDP6646732.1 IclR family transcriptional regulator [Rhodospirillales bacterium]MDP6840590.1 IclR family transcriptional regulator [Rhodospirillales bacterium]